MHDMVIIDEGPITRKTLFAGLGTLGWTVAVFASALKAKAEIDLSGTRLVVMDLGLSGIHSAVFAQCLRRSCPWLPIIALAGDEEPDSVTAGHFASVVAKSCPVDHLAALLSHVIGVPPKHAEKNSTGDNSRTPVSAKAVAGKTGSVSLGGLPPLRGFPLKVAGAGRTVRAAFPHLSTPHSSVSPAPLLQRRSHETGLPAPVRATSAVALPRQGARCA